MSVGRRKPWREVLKAITGQKELDIAPLKKYFAPLFYWLRQQRSELKYAIGW